MKRSITSPQNPDFKVWRSLTESRGIRKHGRFLLSGRKLVRELLPLLPDRFEAALFCAGDDGNTNVESLPQYELAKDLFNQIDEIGTGGPILVGRAHDLLPWNPTEQVAGLTLLTANGDPNNLGALIRSAEAFGVNKIVLLQEAANPFHPRCLKASAGSALRMNLLKGPALNEIPDDCWLLDIEGENINDFQWPDSIKLVVGEEGPGYPPTLRQHKRMKIPMQSSVESLNATVAASIALFKQSSSKNT